MEMLRLARRSLLFWRCCDATHRIQKVREVRAKIHHTSTEQNQQVLRLLGTGVATMKILDLGCRTGSAVAAWQLEGDIVVGVDWEDFGQQILGDFTKRETWEIIDSVNAIWEGDYPTPYDFIWFSPDCSIFSVSGFQYGHFCPQTYRPLTDRAKREVEGIKYVIKQIRERAPRLGWVMENPRALMRKMPFVQDLARVTVSYCQYGDFRMKPTDLFGDIPWLFEPKLCNNGDPCHVAAPRGSYTGTQGMSKTEAGRIPLELSRAIRTAALQSYATPQPTLGDFDE